MDFIENNYILIYASAFCLLQQLLVEVLEENLISDGFVVGKERNILRDISLNCGYSLIRQQNLTRSSFIKFSWNVKPNTMYIWHSYIKIHLSVLHLEGTFYPYMIA